MKGLRSLLWVVALIVGACGDAGATETPSTADPSSVATSVVADAETPDTSLPAPSAVTAPAPTQPPGPIRSLDDYLGVNVPRDPEEAERYRAQQSSAVQESIRACMAEQGFEYIPWVAHQDEVWSEWTGEDTEESRRESGYGLAYSILRGSFEFEEVDDEEPWQDPNVAIMNSMSSAESEAYNYALGGERVDWLPLFEGAETDEEVEAASREMDRLYEQREWKGCSDLAYEQVHIGAAMRASFDEQFIDWWGDIDARVAADRRTVDLELGWSACMAETGYEFRDYDEMWRWLEDEFNRLVVYPYGEGPGGSPIAPEGADEADLEELLEPDYDLAELQAFLELEIAMAVVELDCTATLEDGLRPIRAEYEARWVAENQGELEAWKAEYGPPG